MIKIEMTFTDMDELNDFVRRNVSARTMVAEQFAAPGVYNADQLKDEKSIAMAAEWAKLSAVKAEAPKEEKPSSPPPAESAAPGVTYDDLKASIMKLVAKNPAEMKKVCEAFGLKTFAGTTDPVLWAKAKEMIDAKVAA